MNRRCESLYSTLPLNRFSPHLPGSLEIVLYSTRYFTPVEGICKGGLVLLPNLPENYFTAETQRRRETAEKSTWLIRITVTLAERMSRTVLVDQRFPASYLTRS